MNCAVAVEIEIYADQYVYSARTNLRKKYTALNAEGVLFLKANANWVIHTFSMMSPTSMSASATSVGSEDPPSPNTASTTKSVISISAQSAMSRLLEINLNVSRPIRRLFKRKNGSSR